ncbi:SRPBCC family protein [Deefgea sp. CFH1-16]|uniref:SRPBCC family protein n=1 Tax=Deefgea sp. CFH1-16 TaxID=2675457 RepID=UPI0015F48D7B|nr:SRPBCC family protein [Deefgea sp. CFH1-16]MBM5574691.1 polyketide cyclase/dehydrase and lipid transport [Deefgea sp. CFH1-16]
MIYDMRIYSMYTYKKESVMLSWSFSATVTTQARAEQIWSLWSEPQNWSLWDEGIEWVQLDGEFVSGTKGFLKPVGAGKIRFQILESVRNQSFRDRSFLPLTHLDFCHQYTPNADKSGGLLHYSVQIHGWLMPLFWFVIGRDVKKNLALNMRKLAQHAEQLP